MIQNQVGGGSGDVYSFLTGTKNNARSISVPGLTDKHKVLSIQTAEKFSLSNNGYWLLALSIDPDSNEYHTVYFDSRKSLFWHGFGSDPLSVSGTTITLNSGTGSDIYAGTYQVLVYGPPIS